MHFIRVLNSDKSLLLFNFDFDRLIIDHFLLHLLYMFLHICPKGASDEHYVIELECFSLMQKDYVMLLLADFFLYVFIRFLYRIIIVFMVS